MTTNDHFRQRDMMRLTWSETIFSRIVPEIIATKMAKGFALKERVRHRHLPRHQLPSRAGEHLHRHPPPRVGGRAHHQLKTLTLGSWRRGAAASPPGAIALIRVGPNARVLPHRRPLQRQFRPVHVGTLLREPSLPRRISLARQRGHAKTSLRWTGKRRRETYRK